MSPVQITQLNIAPGVIDLGVGQPDPELLPFERMREAIAHRIAQPDPLPWLAYGVEQGNGYFRVALARFLAEGYRLPVAADDLFVTAGASQGLDLVCSLFTRPGDTILVEDPTYFLALRIFADHGLTAVGVPMDRLGVVPDALAEALAEHRPALFYTVPTFHNPTSVTLAEARRERVVELALRHQVPIVADEVYHLLPHGSAPPPPLAAWAGTGAEPWGSRW
jgi:DNA-binding transcriptional MocR family regulator